MYACMHVCVCVCTCRYMINIYYIYITRTGVLKKPLQQAEDAVILEAARCIQAIYAAADATVVGGGGVDEGGGWGARGGCHAVCGGGDEGAQERGKLSGGRGDGVEEDAGGGVSRSEGGRSRSEGVEGGGGGGGGEGGLRGRKSMGGYTLKVQEVALQVYYI